MHPDQPFWHALFPADENAAAAGSVQMRLLKKKGRPLLLLPNDRHAAAATFALYPAQTAKARLIRNGLRRMAGLGFTVGDRVELKLSKSDGFVNYLSGLVQASGDEAPTLGILAGNPASPCQRFMILVFNQQLEPVVVVKTGLHPEARELVVHESKFLGSLPANQAGLPRLRGTFQNNRLDAFATDFFAGDSPNANELGHVSEMLCAWITPNETTRLQEFAEWQALERSAPMDVRAIPGYEGIRDQVVHRTLYHGDFAPWNIKVDAAGNWTVLDWERGQARGIPGWDWFHYFLQHAILVEKLTDSELLKRAERILNTSEFQNYARASQIEGIERGLMLAYLLHVVHVIKPAEGLEQTDQLWRTMGKQIK